MGLLCAEGSTDKLKNEELRMKNEEFATARRTLMGRTFNYHFSILILLLAACAKHPSLPSNYSKIDADPAIWPDYRSEERRVGKEC